MARWGPLLILFLANLVEAQSQPGSSTTLSNATSTTLNVTSIITSTPVATRTIVSAGNTLQSTSFVPTTIVLTLAPPVTETPTSTTSDNATATGTTAPTESSGPTLDTKVDPAFGVLGALLILTGLPSAFLGHKNRWSSFFLTGFYTLALICISLILKFGVLVAIHPPDKALRGLFVLAAFVAGVAGGGVSIFFWQQTKYFIGAWGGFAIGLWIQSFRDGGMIREIGFRWILYAGMSSSVPDLRCATTGFVLCTIPKFHYHVMILGTAFTGASACMLGVDCFTTVGLKEFYIYNLGFTTLFPKFAGMHFPVSQEMDIEIGFIAALALAGTAVQLRVLQVLKRKLYEINKEEQKREALAEEKAVKRFENVRQDLEQWEKDHGHDKPKSVSELSAVPLMRDPEDAPSTPGGDSTVVSHHQRTRTRSALSEYGINDAPRPLSRFSQTPGLLPAMNLGLGLESELPGNLAANDPRLKDPELMQKEALLAEIQTIRRSIDALRSESDSISGGGGDSRRPSMSLHTRTLSGDVIQSQAIASSSRGQRVSRDRVQSMDILSPFDDRRASDAAGINRPVSTPLRDDEWDAYVRERKLFQPPGGPSAPIAPTYVAPIPRPASAFVQVPDAVAEALAQRKHRESALEIGTSAVLGDALMDGKRVSPFAGAPRAHKRSASLGPVNILPPRVSASKPEPDSTPAARTYTYEELLERHQQKIRSLQDPLSKQEKEEAVLAETKARWERNKAVEKEVMAKKLAEKEAALAKKAKEENRRSKGGDTLLAASGSRLDRLGFGTGGKRGSSSKVQDWQKYQQEVGTAPPENKKDSTRRRPTDEEGGLPFPNTTARGASTNKRRSRPGVLRDPPS
ncbi:hypothetical protein BU17DRAFT_44118 [Hysterangium stoloniferum]|nr:hypothetical protein BU17DRAFT_44118 [Hysterangium stoloniferum]